MQKNGLWSLRRHTERREISQNALHSLACESTPTAAQQNQSDLKEILRDWPCSSPQLSVGCDVKKLLLRRTDRLTDWQTDRLTSRCSAAHFILVGFSPGWASTSPPARLRNFKIQRLAEGCRWTRVSAGPPPAGKEFWLRARPVLFLGRRGICCAGAAAAAGSGRPTCQMGFSSDGHLRKRRLEVKDVAPTARQSDLPTMGGANLLNLLRFCIWRDGWQLRRMLHNVASRHANMEASSGTLLFRSQLNPETVAPPPFSFKTLIGLDNRQLINQESCDLWSLILAPQDLCTARPWGKGFDPGDNQFSLRGFISHSQGGSLLLLSDWATTSNSSSCGIYTFNSTF